MLERPHFSTLQQKISPIYFSLQTALPVILAITYPGARSPLGTASGPSGFFAGVNRWSVFAPLLTVFVTSLVNLVYVGPATTKVMLERRRQGENYCYGSRDMLTPGSESKDGKKCFDPPPHSKEMQQLNKAFGRMHGASSLLNMAALLATIWYGVTIAERLQ